MTVDFTLVVLDGQLLMKYVTLDGYALCVRPILSSPINAGSCNDETTNDLGDTRATKERVWQTNYICWSKALEPAPNEQTQAIVGEP